MKNVAISDAELWSRSLKGDGAAFGMLFDLHQNRVFRHAYHLVEDRRDAEDATAVAFFELWRRRTDVRLVNESVLPWLLVTATNAARNARRSTARYRRLLASLPRTAVTPVAEASYFVSDPTELMDHQLATALRSLPVTDLRMISLVALEGFSVTEAAVALGLSNSAAKSRLHRARSRIRTILGDSAHDMGWSVEEGGR